MNGNAQAAQIVTMEAVTGKQNEDTKAPDVLFCDATRLQESFTARVERRVLGWIALRLPPWIGPDHLTLLGLAAMLLAGASYALSRSYRSGLILASICLVMNWFGDSLDGTLARLRQCQRPRYGFYVDHVIDTVGTLFLMGGLALSGYIDWRIALGMYISFLMLAIESYLAAYSLRTFRLSCGKFGPTEIRILLAMGNTALWIHPDVRVAGTPYRLFDGGGAIAMIAMVIMFVVLSVRHTIELYREEPVKGIRITPGAGENCFQPFRGTRALQSAELNKRSLT